MLRRADISYCATWPCPIRWPDIVPPLTAQDASLQGNPDHSHKNWDLPQHSQHRWSKVLSPELTEVAEMLHILPLRPPPNDVRPSERQTINYACMAIERKLITSHSIDAGGSTVTLFSDMFRSAAHLYVSLALRDLPSGARIVSTLGEKLQQCIHQIEEVQNTVAAGILSTEKQTIMLWSCIVHLATTPKFDQSSPIVSRILRMIVDIDLRTVDALLKVLRRIAWTDDFLKHTLTTLVEWSRQLATTDKAFQRSCR